MHTDTEAKMEIWEVLRPQRIKKAYAARAKMVHPEEKPEEPKWQ